MQRPISRRRFIHGGIAAATAIPFARCAHMSGRRLPRVGFMSGAVPSLVAAFEEEFRALGYVHGNNVHLVTRLARPNTSDNAVHAAELASMDLDFIVVAALPQALAVRAANPAMPMVIITCPGMVSNGFAQSLERPGGIYTGLDELPPGVTVRRLQLLTSAAPHVSRIALLSTTPGSGGHETQLMEAEDASTGIDVEVRPYRATSLAELRSALEAIARDEMQGLLNFQGGLSLANREMIVRFVEDRRMPAVYQSELFVDVGGLMCWAPDQREQYRIGARYADRIIKGTRPGDIPIVHPSPYYLMIDLRAAARIGLTIPDAVIAQAHEVKS